MGGKRARPLGRMSAPLVQTCQLFSVVGLHGGCSMKTEDHREWRNALVRVPSAESENFHAELGAKETIFTIVPDSGSVFSRNSPSIYVGATTC